MTKQVELNENEMCEANTPDTTENGEPNIQNETINPTADQVNVVTKEKSPVNEKALVVEIKELMTKICFNFIELGHKLFEFKEISGKGFRKKCQELLGIREDAANNFIRTYERFKNPEYAQVIQLIPESAWKQLSKKSVDESTVNKVIEEIKNNENCRKYNDVVKLIKKYRKPTEIQNNNHQPLNIDKFIETIKKKWHSFVSEVTEKNGIDAEYNAIISDILNTAFNNIREAVSKDKRKAA